MNDKTLNIAIIGCGAIAERQHLPLLAQRSDCRITALVDRNEQRTRALAASFGVAQAFTDVESLKQVQVDAAVVALPSALHGPVGTKLLDRGIHVLMEKPLAISASDCDMLLGRSNAQVLEFRTVHPMGWSVGYARPHPEL